MFITIFSTVFGFAREIVLTYYYGASAVSDVYLISQTIPSSVFAMVGAGIAMTFIPIYSKILKEEGEDRAFKFTSNIMNLFFVASSIIVILVLLFTPQIVKVFAGGFSEDSLNLAILFTRISIFGVYFSGALVILNGFLHIKGNFLIPAIIGIPMNIALIISFYLASKGNYVILAYGIIASLAVQLIVVIFSVIKYRIKYEIIFNFKDKYIKEILILSLPVILGASVNQVNVLVDKSIASTLAVGGISALNYANRLNGFIQGLFVLPVLTVIYPTISKMVLDLNEAGLKKTINESIVSVSLLVIPATVGAMIYSRPIVELLFLRGEFDSSAASMTSQALLLYSIGMIASSIRDIITRVFYSYNDTKTPMINSAFCVVLNIILSLILSRFLGVGGLALATSVSIIVMTLILVLSLKKRVPTFGFRISIHSVLKITIISLIMGFVSFVFYKYLSANLSQNIALIISIVIAIAVYLPLILFSKIPEVKTAIQLVKSKVNRK